MEVARVDIEFGKSAFHVHAVGRDGKVVMEKRFTRRALGRFPGEVEPCLEGLDACGGAYHWARVLLDLGHDAWLMSPQFAKPCVKSNENDFRGAESICEAASRPSMRFVPVKGSVAILTRNGELSAMGGVRGRHVNDFMGRHFGGEIVL